MSSVLASYHTSFDLPAPPMELRLDDFPLGSRLPVAELAAGSVAAVGFAVDRLTSGRWLSGRSPMLVPDRIAASFSSDKLLRIGGQSITGFAEASGFFRCQDGWVRTHGNYPHHRGRLLDILDLPHDAGRDDIARRIAERSGRELEAAAAQTGAILVRVREHAEWAIGEQWRAAAAVPLVTVTASAPVTQAADPSPATGRSTTITGSPKPLSGIRVLDLTRVLSGPVATRTLALLGADVLRIDAPFLPEIDWHHLDNDQGKRTTALDLGQPHDHHTFQRLLDDADVLITGYRPGAMDRLELRPRPGTVWGRVSAWGEYGPWHYRRGFDSIVQAASGISVIEGSADQPGALPMQALDHGSGYLLAAAVIDALALTTHDQLSREVSVSLARTARWLLTAPNAEPSASRALAGDLTTAHGDLVTTRPALAEFDNYPFPARPYAADDPSWN